MSGNTVEDTSNQSSVDGTADSSANNTSDHSTGGKSDEDADGVLSPVGNVNNPSHSSSSASQHQPTNDPRCFRNVNIAFGNIPNTAAEKCRLLNFTKIFLKERNAACINLDCGKWSDRDIKDVQEYMRDVPELSTGCWSLYYDLGVVETGRYIIKGATENHQPARVLCDLNRK